MNGGHGPSGPVKAAEIAGVCVCMWVCVWGGGGGGGRGGRGCICVCMLHKLLIELQPYI